MNNLKVDWNYVPENIEKRSQKRLKIGEIKKMVPEIAEILCVINTRQDLFSGSLENVSASGISVRVYHPFSYFKKDEELRIRFNISNAVFNIKGIIRRIDLDNIGIEFIDMKEEVKRKLLDFFRSYFLLFKIKGI